MKNNITLDDFYKRVINEEEIKKTDCIALESNTTDRCDTYFYARESTKRQAEEGFNLDMQVKRGLEYCNYRGIKKCIMYKERGKSAKTTNRSELNKLKDMIKNGKVKRVIVYKLDRLVRRLEGLSELIKLFREYDVELISLCEEINTNSAIGRMITNMIVSIAEWEQDTISERTNDGLLEGAEQGFYMIGGHKPFGYDKCASGHHNTLEINKEEYRILHNAYDLFKKGYSVFAITMIINNDVYMKSINKRCGENQLYRWLKNPILKGVMNFKEKEYKLDIETVFSIVEFNDIQKLIKERQKNSKYDYLFANKVRSMNGSLSSIKSTVKPNNVYLYYYDNETKKRVNESEVKNAVIEHLKKNNALYKALRNRTYESDLKFMNSKRKTIELMYSNCEITTETYKNELLQIENDIKTIKRYRLIYIQNIETYFNNLSFKEQRKIIWKHIGYIEIDYSCKEVIKIN